MYEPEAVDTLVGLIRSGLLDLSHYAVTEFPLSEINHAITHAAENSGPFKLTVVRP
jgi:alcohol dehydrogenase